MNVLIVGGTGLISTAITEVLLSGGHQVTLLTRGRTAMRLPDGLARPKVIVGDRKTKGVVALAARGGERFDAVIDMVAFGLTDVQEAVEALRGQTSQYLFISSVDAYRKPYVQYPITLAHPRGGLTAYGQAKAACEEWLLAADAASDLRVTVIRPGHSTGEGGQGLDLFGWNSHYLDRIVRGLPLILHGDGQSLWGTCYVGDVARAIVNALGNPRALGRAFHLTADQVFTWNAYYEATAKALGVAVPARVGIPSSLLQGALPQLARECAENFLFNNLFDNTEAHDVLNFRNTVPFEEITQRVYNWLIANNRLQRAEDQPHYGAILAAWEQVREGFIAAVRPFDRDPSRLGFE